ncbi:hypothetical protein AX23_08370 [Brucella melitensis 548]|nr:hypothetical protein AX23_08370 [Brucella melitensis 548]
MIAECFDLKAGKLLIHRLDFLQADDVGRRLPQPMLEIVDARLDAVDVPCSDFHSIMIMRSCGAGQARPFGPHSFSSHIPVTARISAAEHLYCRFCVPMCERTKPDRRFRMFDAKKFLDQFLGSQVPGMSGSVRDKAGQVTDMAKKNPLATGAIAAAIFGTKTGRKLAGNVATVGGIAAIAGLGYLATRIISPVRPRRRWNSRWQKSRSFFRRHRPIHPSIRILPR